MYRLRKHLYPWLQFEFETVIIQENLLNQHSFVKNMIGLYKKNRKKDRPTDKMTYLINQSPITPKWMHKASMNFVHQHLSWAISSWTLLTHITSHSSQKCLSLSLSISVIPFSSYLMPPNSVLPALDYPLSYIHDLGLATSTVIVSLIHPLAAPL